MSNEEAIAQLTFLHHIETDRKAYRLVASIEMAISALESIDRITAERDAAIDGIKAAIVGANDYCFLCKNLELDGQCHQVCVPNTRNWSWEWRGIE